MVARRRLKGVAKRLEKVTEETRTNCKGAAKESRKSCRGFAKETRKSLKNMSVNSKEENESSHQNRTTVYSENHSVFAKFQDF